MHVYLRLVAVAIVSLHATLACALDNDVENAAAVANGTIVDGFRLSVQAKRSKLPVGQPVELLVTIANVGDVNLTAFSTTKFRDIYLVVDQDRRRVPLTRLGLHYENREKWQNTRNVPFTLKPGESATLTIADNLFYDMTLAGNYQLYAAYRVPARGEIIPQAWTRIEAGPTTVELTSP